METLTDEGSWPRSAQRRAREMADQQETYWAGRSTQAAGSTSAAERLAKGLGWFSIGLGLAQVAAPRAMARLTGVGDQPRKHAFMRAIGLRELAAGIGILTRRRPVGFLWSRVAGDIMDLLLLRAAFGSRRSDSARVAGSLAAVAGVAALDLYSSVQLARSRSQEGKGEGTYARREREEGEPVVASLTIERSPEELYRFFRQLDNLPKFMAHVEDVRVMDERRSHWVVRGPAGTTVEWDAEITEDRANQLIAWRSVDGARVPNWGSVRFEPAVGGRGTVVRLDLRYKPPAGKVGKGIAMLFGEEPGQQAAGDLRRFKQVVETGEVTHSDASIHRGKHPARPDERGGRQ